MLNDTGKTERLGWQIEKGPDRIRFRSDADSFEIPRLSSSSEIRTLETATALYLWSESWLVGLQAGTHWVYGGPGGWPIWGVRPLDQVVLVIEELQATCLSSRGDIISQAILTDIPGSFDLEGDKFRFIDFEGLETVYRLPGLEVLEAADVNRNSV
ncbi:hypothetical protein [Maricaulis parjimensis]|uniref:hypothetical protein n=1 Tax=Maricaulis parjimensis TaxID=144023 RepID=UPI00193AD68E|nr:hypothetical protein [Maricaulis parjimensis]